MHSALKRLSGIRIGGDDSPPLDMEDSLSSSGGLEDME